MKAIFLDKDGTLVDDVPYNAEPRRITLCSGAGAALRLLARCDYRLFVISNQDGIAHGYFGEAAMDCVERRLADLLFREQLSLDGFYYCPHHPDGKVQAYALHCTCRKPMPGMLLRAAREHGIDLRASWMVGDILHDVEAGNRAGCRTLLIDKGNETEWQLGPHRVPTRIATDLYGAAVMIVNDDEARR
ncbi:D-glycero-alpha-D-manno-heptose-1,7-bisphosphate 7-phosphatase [Massilia scottii]|uniref:D-glycero-alpha-D-manno-heptose-1,7-bisphosphate 7-phosphatase n=1 Tax=Massilia scottii TaxID=3057166 RepID=UPI002796E274|nr:HAD family hydrolase [Massilia sp. CCM 9029]MDQ1834693.1 HAD family hydrolase [Massilia sp. CCM 9029]